jgi:hypothetical protein
VYGVLRDHPKAYAYILLSGKTGERGDDGQGILSVQRMEGSK